MGLYGVRQAMPQKTKTQRPGRPTSKRGHQAQRPIPWFKVGWGVVGALLLISSSVWFYLGWYNINEYCTRSPQIQGVRVGLAGPAFLSIGDDAELAVTAINERSTPADLSGPEIRWNVAVQHCCRGELSGELWTCPAWRANQPQDHRSIPSLPGRRYIPKLARQAGRV